MKTDDKTTRRVELAKGKAMEKIGAGVLRCDHAVGFMGMRILHLHYRIERAR